MEANASYKENARQLHVCLSDIKIHVFNLDILAVDIGIMIL